MEVKPFKAFRFDSGTVGDVGSCIAPPYDVISPAQQEQLYKKNEYNIVRIIKGKTTPSDNPGNNQYTRAADYLNSWLKKGVLKQDLAEAIYAYVQDFQRAGTQFQRFSFIALAKLEKFGKTVRPHEQTLIEPKIDRLNLKRATVAKFGLVFMLYEDEKKIADQIVENTAGKEPLVDFVDEQNVRHRLFAITTKSNIDAIAKMMLDKSCIIADGHHRYETALNYYKETANPAAAYQIIAFVNTHNEGLVILATHRLVGNLENFQLERLLADLKESFEISEYHFDSPQAKTDARQKALAQMKVEQQNDKNAFVIYGGGNAFYLAVLRDKHAMDAVAPNMSGPWKSLDVSVLHKLILEKILGIGEKQLAGGTQLEYIKDTDNAIDESIARVDAGQKQAAFFMNPVKMQQLKMVTAAGEKMPQKSTYFYPKIYTGLTINKL
ncbi:hypothetical protein ES707_03502 [subsurface metagenome]